MMRHHLVLQLKGNGEVLNKINDGLAKLKLMVNMLRFIKMVW